MIMTRSNKVDVHSVDVVHFSIAFYYLLIMDSERILLLSRLAATLLGSLYSYLPFPPVPEFRTAG